MYREKIEAYIEEHKQEMLEDIIELCRINSEKMPYMEGMPYGEGPFLALTAALNMAEGYGLHIRNYDNYVGTADLNDKEAQLDILAHLDVVPAGEGWKVTEAYEPVLQDGRIYGRGTADDKGPALAALFAMRAVKELGIPLQKNVRLILGTDEECGSTDIEHYYAVEKEAPMTFSPDAEYPVVNIEKGRLNGHFTAQFKASGALPRIVSIEAGTKVNVLPGKACAYVEGLLESEIDAKVKQTEEDTGIRFEIQEKHSVMEIIAIGKGAHASMPEEGNNALTGLLTLLRRLPLAVCEQVITLHKLAELFPHGDTSGKALGIAMEDELSGDLTLAFSLFTLTDSSLEGEFDSRCPICSNEENVLEVVREQMKKAGVIFRSDHMKAPHHVDGNSHFVKTLLRVYEDYTGRKGACQAIGGGTYVHELQFGVAFGAAMPESGNNMHGADEFAVVEDLVVSAKMFAQIIVDLCS